MVSAIDLSQNIRGDGTSNGDVGEGQKHHAPSPVFIPDAVVSSLIKGIYRFQQLDAIPMFYQNVLIILGREIWVTSIALVVAVTVAVALRFLTKAVTQIGLGADDWWILTAFVLFIPQQALELHGE